MLTHQDIGTLSSRRPLCFQYKSDCTTTSTSQEQSALEKHSFLHVTMDSTYTTNKASPVDQFCRHSLAVLFDNAVESKEHDKTRLRKVLRQVSLDTLATEWLNCEPRTIENRAYLIGTVLPQVVFGLEHVLREAVSRQLIGPDAKAEAIERESADPNFNPINRLAEFLMRNNHRYSNFTETSPYVRGIRNTVAKLQHEMFMRSDNQLARLKAAVLRTQEERVKREAAEKAEYERRNACLSELFDEFLTGGQVSVESTVIHNSVRTFLELAIKMPDPLKQCLIPLYETQIVEEPPSAYQKPEFILYVMLYAKPMTSELFDQFVKHLKLCASEYRQATEREEKKHIFTKFFVTCNTDQLDILSREKVLNLCETYFESAPPDLRQLLRDPRDWPVREYHLRSVQNAQATSAEKSQDSYEQEPDENNDAFITDQNNSATFTPVIDMEQSSEEPAQTNMRSDTLISDVGPNTSPEEPADLEFEIVSKVELSGDFTSTLKEEESEEEEGMVVVEKQKEEEGAPVRCENTSDEEQTGTDNEEAANCNRTPANKNLREKTLIDALSARSTLYSRSTSTQSIRQLSFGYQPDKLTLAQFLHMMDCFLRDCAPKTVIQKFVTFLERQYHEDRIWREKMLMQANFSSFMENVKNKLSKLFVTMDNDSVGFVNLQLIEEEISQYQKGYYIPALVKAKRKLIQHVEFTRQAIQVAAKTTEESEPKANLVKTSVNADSMSVKKPLTVSNSQTIPLNQHDFQFLMINTIWPKLHLSTKLDSSINVETLDNLADFVAQRQQRDLEQQVMMNDRQAWLQTIDNAAKESVTSFNQVYRAVFQALIKDAIKYGEGKRISANISILTNPSTTERRWTANPIRNGPSRLRCVSAVPEEEASWLVGMELVASEPNISFLALKTAAMIHVPRFLTATSYSIHYWRKHQTLSALSKQTVPYRAPVQSASGEIPNSVGEILDPTPNSKRLPVQNELASCVVIPIADPTHKLIGVVGVDTMWSTKNRSNFEETELNFYQGVASRFGHAYVLVGVRRLLAQIVLAAFHWLGQHLDHVERMTFYYCLDHDRIIAKGENDTTKITKPDDKRILTSQRTCDLWTLVEKHQNKSAVVCQEPKVLQRSKNFFRSHLFSVADTAEPGEKNVLGKQHLSFPLRDSENVAIGIVDICTGTCVGGKSDLTVEEMQYVINMMGILELIYRELIQKVGLQVGYNSEDVDRNIANIISKPDVTKRTDEVPILEPSILETYRPETIFPLLTQAELKTMIDKATPEVYSELHSYLDPPPTVFRTIRMVIRLLNPQLAATMANKSWDKCKQLIASCIQKQIATFDPFTTLMEEHREELRHFIAENSANDVEKHGSYPTKLLYQWLRCCISALDMKLAYDHSY